MGKSDIDDTNSTSSTLSTVGKPTRKVGTKLTPKEHRIKYSKHHLNNKPDIREKNNIELENKLIDHGIVPPPETRNVNWLGRGELVSRLGNKGFNHMKNYVDSPKAKEMNRQYHLESINDMLNILTWPAIDISDVKAIETRAYEYLCFCAENNRPVTNRGLYLALGVTKSTVDNWAKKTESDPELAHCATKILSICSAYREMSAAENKLNPVLTIWWQKNYDGMSNKQEVQLTVENPMGDRSNLDELERKYKASVGKVWVQRDGNMVEEVITALNDNEKDKYRPKKDGMD